MSWMKRATLSRPCALAALFAFQALGCGRESANQAVDNALARAGKARDAVSPLAGKVTIDGQAPDLKPAQRLFVMLHDRAKLETAPALLFKATCKANGEFSFNSYLQGDGVPPGKYVVTFVELRQAFHQGFRGPDLLKNLYNDPDANAKTDEFVIDHRPPGKTDYLFDLKINDREPATPGPHAVTTLRQ
jgi:hypothetical protein